MKDFKKLKNLISNILFYFIIGLLIFTGLTARINNEIPTVFGYSFMHVISASMEPTIMTDDVVIGKVINADDEIELNGIYVYNREYDALKIIHRIIDKVDDSYQFKGDNNSNADPDLVDRENIKIKYLFKIPQLGKLIKLFQNMYTYLVLGILYLIFFIIIPIINEKRKAAK